MAQKLVANTTAPNRQPIAKPPSASQTAPCWPIPSRNASIIRPSSFSPGKAPTWLVRLSPRGRGREAMTYGRTHLQHHEHTRRGAVVSHSAELVRGYLLRFKKGPLIRPFGASSPRGENVPCGF